MGTDKNEMKKKVLDTLKDELQGLTEDENQALTGGFTGTGLERNSPVEGINGYCGANKSACGANSVSGCGGTSNQETSL